MQAFCKVGRGVGGTFAWLTSKSEAVVNTFTIGDITIDLKESEVNTDGFLKYPTATDGNWDSLVKAEGYKFVPGLDLNKNPTVRVDKGSEACWLFVKIEESANWPEKATYGTASGWTLVSGTTNVYYKSVEANDVATANGYYPILNNDEIVVADTLTKADVTGSATLTFTAYAIQKATFATAEAAWAEAKNLG